MQLTSEQVIELKRLREDVKTMNSGGWATGMITCGVIAVIAWSVQHDYYGMQAFAGIGIAGFIVCFLMVNSIDTSRKTAETRIAELESVSKVGVVVTPQSGITPEGYI